MNFKYSLLVLIAGASMLFAFSAHAATLSPTQVNNVVSLLQSYGAAPTTITQVENVLGVPTASITLNGSNTITVYPGEAESYAWTSTNGLSASTTLSDTYNGVTSSPAPWHDGAGNPIANTLSGSLNAAAVQSQVGHTYTVVYSVLGQDGQIATSTLTIKTQAPPASIVIFSTGQSNLMVTNPYTWTPPSNLLVWNFPAYSAPSTATTGGSAFVAPNATVSNVAVLFAAKIAAANPNEQVYLVNVPYGGEPIAQWFSGAGVPDMYDATRNNVAAALAQIPGKTAIDYFVWWQGESDAGSANYLTNLSTVDAAYHTQSWFASTTKEVFFGINSQENPLYPAPSGYDTIDTQIQQFVAQNPSQRTFVYTGDLAFNNPTYPPVGVHLDAQGQVDAANRAYALLTGTPAASLTVNGQSSETLTPGNPDPGVWTSTNGVSASSALYDTLNGVTYGPYNWVDGANNPLASTLFGDILGSQTVQSQVGNTYTIVYTVVGKNGQTASSTMQLTVVQ